MTFFQILLILFLLIFIVYNIKFKNKTYERLFMVMLSILGIVLVLYPDLSSKLANLLSIGRGTDLIFYIWILFSLFKFLQYETRINELYKIITDLVRHVSIDNVETPNNK